MTIRNLTIEKVIDAATEIASEQGFEQITLTKTANQLNVQPQSMYRYVKNTADLKSKVLAHNLKKMVDQSYKELLGLTGTQAIKKYMTMVAFGEYTQVAPHDFANVSKYMDNSEVRYQYDRLNNLIPQLLSTFITDESRLRQLTQLLIDYMLGESVTYRNNDQDNQTQRRQDFGDNIDNILNMYKD